MYDTYDPEEYNKTYPRLDFRISNFTRRSLNIFSVLTLFFNCIQSQKLRQSFLELDDE